MGKVTFDEFDIHKLEDGESPDVYWFEAAMVSTCKPLFDDCEDNHAVEAKLRSARVISESCKTDSESCALVVNFRTKASGVHFIERLNKYLAKKQAMLEEARRF